MLCWKVSNSMDSIFYEEALKEVLSWCGTAAIFNNRPGKPVYFGYSYPNPLNSTSCFKFRHWKRKWPPYSQACFGLVSRVQHTSLDNRRIV